MLNLSRRPKTPPLRAGMHGAACPTDGIRLRSGGDSANGRMETPGFSPESFIFIYSNWRFCRYDKRINWNRWWYYNCAVPYLYFRFFPTCGTRNYFGDADTAYRYTCGFSLLQTGACQSSSCGFNMCGLCFGRVLWGKDCHWFF